MCHLTEVGVIEVLWGRVLAGFTSFWTVFGGLAAFSTLGRESLDSFSSAFLTDRSARCPSKFVVMAMSFAIVILD